MRHTIILLVLTILLGKTVCIVNKTDQCPPYKEYALSPHPPYSPGPLQVPYQRPPPECRTFHSELVDKVNNYYKNKLKDSDLAQIFENCFSNTLDTTIQWHTLDAGDGFPRTVVITGDIGAEWIRDSRYQLWAYLHLCKYDHELELLVQGAIHTQAEFLQEFPYCNALQPPGSHSTVNSRQDQKAPKLARTTKVSPKVDYKKAFECKYEVDSLASFLGLSADYYFATQNETFINDAWTKAIRVVYNTIIDQSVPTFKENGSLNRPYYRYQSRTWVGSETLPLDGVGNPVNSGTNLIKSSFRPSDDAAIFPFFIPGNALLSVELKRVAQVLSTVVAKMRAEGNVQPTSELEELGTKLGKLGKTINEAVWEHGVYENRAFGTVFAYEVDGYGSVCNMDDAGMPSLLSLPDIGFVSVDNDIYQNTRNMVLNQSGNPYYVGTGKLFQGIGSPHIALGYAWPLSHIIQLRTSQDDMEIMHELDLLKNSTGGLGLMHEAIDQDSGLFTRPWFAWCNSELARALIELASRKPYLVVKEDLMLTLDGVAEAVLDTM